MSLNHISLIEVRSNRVGVGGSVRIAKGFWLHAGKLLDSSNENELKVIDKGTFILTTKRYIFLGGGKTIDQPLSRIGSIVPFPDGIGIARSNKQKIEYFSGGYYWPNISSIIKGVVNRFGK
jgi:hypothetical protein